MVIGQIMYVFMQLQNYMLDLVLQTVGKFFKFLAVSISGKRTLKSVMDSPI